MRACTDCVGGIETAAQEIVLNLFLEIVRSTVPAFSGKLLLLSWVDGQTRRSNGELN